MGIAIYPARFPAQRSTRGRLWYACLWSLPSSCSQNSAEWLWHTRTAASVITEEQRDHLEKLVKTHTRDPSHHCNTFYLPRESQVNSSEFILTPSVEQRGWKGEPSVGIARRHGQPHRCLLLTPAAQPAETDVPEHGERRLLPKAVARETGLGPGTRCKQIWAPDSFNSICRIVL